MAKPTPKQHDERSGTITIKVEVGAMKATNMTVSLPVKRAWRIFALLRAMAEMHYEEKPNDQ